MIIKNKKSLKRLVISLIVITVVSFTSLFIYNYNENKVKIKNGSYSYSEKLLPERLIGEWRFSYNELLDYTDYESIDECINVPGFWNINTEYQEYGYATYMLKVTNVIPGESYGIKIPTFGTAGKVFIDNYQIAEAGQVSDSADGHQSKFKIFYRDFIAQDTSFIIVIQISNYDYARAGMWLPIQLSSSENMMHYQNSKAGMEHITLGMFIFTLLLTLGIIISIKAPRHTYNFVGTVVFAILQQLVCGEKLIIYWFPSISMNTIVKIQYIVTYCMSMFALRTISYFCKYPKSVRPIVDKIIDIYSKISILLSLSVVFFSIHFTTSIIAFSKIFAYIGMIISVTIIIITIINGKHFMENFLYSAVFLCICIIHDFLYRATIINVIGEITVYGYLFVIIAVGRLLLIDTIRVQEQAKLSKVYEQAYLNSQISSHFLFNSLNTIANTISKNSLLAEELVVSLSTFLRNTSVRDNLKQLVPLSKELETLRAYTSIVESRFNNIKIEIDVPNDHTIMIPPMTLQPLVENAVNHGLRKKREGGKIKVSVYQNTNNYTISVSDNGVGIPSQKLCSIESELNTEMIQISPEIGISLVNINTRLKNQLNTELHITSTIKAGTTIEFKIPLVCD